MPVNILNLPAYAVTDIHESEHDYHIYAETVEPPITCAHCGSEDLVGFGRREQTIKDLPIHAKRVGIYINTRRYQCRSCWRTFYERLPATADNRMMTARLVAWIGKQSLNRTFLSIADETGVDEKTIRNIFRDYVNELERTVRFDVPQIMGIDEIHIIRPRCVVSNIDSKTAVEILRDRNKKTVINYLSKLDNREHVRVVAMDMWEPYKDAVYATLPNATIVIDKFHVVRMASDCMEMVRKSLRASLTDKQRIGLKNDRHVLRKRESELVGLERIRLESWTRNFPSLGDAYRAKEEFYAIYDAGHLDEGFRRYEKWQASLTPNIREAFFPLTRAVTNWQPEIFNYFEHRVTNAYTESLNSLIRVMDRLGRGYSFEALRAKILFTEGVHKTGRLKGKFKKHDRSAQPNKRTNAFSFGRMVDFGGYEDDQIINYGADLSIIAQLIEEGRF